MTLSPEEAAEWAKRYNDSLKPLEEIPAEQVDDALYSDQGGTAFWGDGAIAPCAVVDTASTDGKVVSKASEGPVSPAPESPAR